MDETLPGRKRINSVMKKRFSPPIVCATLLLFLVAFCIALAHVHYGVSGTIAETSCLVCSWLHTLRWADVAATVFVLFYVSWVLYRLLSAFPSFLLPLASFYARAPPVFSQESLGKLSG
jgi:hypothetical protein